jgi:superfamily II DNA helicase RecQ
MPYKTFTICLSEPDQAEKHLNDFLGAHHIVKLRADFLPDGSGYAFLVEYTRDGKQLYSGKPKIDYREELSEEDFAVFTKLRDIRKSLAEAESQPVYAVFTNEQLALIARKKPSSISALKEIKGVGEAKALKYGEKVLALFNPQEEVPF